MTLEILAHDVHFCCLKNRNKERKPKKPFIKNDIGSKEEQTEQQQNLRIILFTEEVVLELGP